MDYAQLGNSVLTLLNRFGQVATLTSSGTGQVARTPLVWGQREKSAVNTPPTLTTATNRVAYLPANLRTPPRVGDYLTVGGETRVITRAAEYAPGGVTVAWQVEVQ